MKPKISKPVEDIPNYKLRDGLISPQEITLLQCLQEVFDNKHRVLMKVSLAELVVIPDPDRRYLAHWRRVQRRTLDFIVCLLPTFTPILAVKMETETDSRRRRASGRDVLDTVLQDIELPLLRLRTRDKHEAKDLARQISFLLQETTETHAAGIT